MARWEPGAKERLRDAAVKLFAERGFDHTTAAEIAESVGLTERTFFRHFSDKRDVLFNGQEQLLQAFLDGVHAAPPEASPLDIVAAGLRSAAPFFSDERRAWSRMRQVAIEQNPALQERERHKMATLATSISEALRVRGVTEPAATLAAETGTTVFTIAFARWIADDEARPLDEIQAGVLQELLALTAQITT